MQSIPTGESQTVPSQGRDPDLLRMVTAGSVDDGKSTLIGRMLYDCGALPEDQVEALRARSEATGFLDLSLVTDGLKAEREQGITIDVAYRYFSTARRRFIIADTPGHEQYTRNMVTGASNADVAIVLIDARLGVLTQSKRHGFIASLLGVPRLVVAINKMDLVGYDEDVFKRISDEYTEFVSRLQFSDLTIIPVSAVDGDNVVFPGGNMPWYDGPTLLSYLETTYIAGDRNLVDFRFPVQRVVRPDQNFRGYAGTVASGVVRPGDEVVVLPGGKRSKVTRIVTYEGDLEAAFPPLAVTICLADHLDISRGDMLAHPNNIPRMEREVDAIIIWMADEPFSVSSQYLIKHTTNTVRGVCSELTYRIDPDTLHRESTKALALNEIGRARLTLYRPVSVDAYRRNRDTGAFILIDPATNVTVGAGIIVDRTRATDERRTTKSSASSNITWQSGITTVEDRARLLGQFPLTLWLTGLSGSGKSTVAFEVERRLLESGRSCYVLDGDNVRHGLNRDLGFLPHERTENIRRVAEVARLMNDAGLIVVTSFISPYREDRALARAVIGDSRFVEAHLSATLDVCEGRDVKGLYARARRGELTEFTGISAPYEAPVAPELQIDTGVLSIEETVASVVAAIIARSAYRDEGS